LVQIIDVEKVLADITPYSTDISEEVLNQNLKDWAISQQLKVLIVDDSSTARHQLKITLNNLGVECIQAKNGAEGLRTLESFAEQGPIVDILLMMITDAEMPEMDGYRLTHEVRCNPNLEDLFIIMHTSLSGAFNEALVEKVGCDRFLSKFKPDAVAAAVQERVSEYKARIENS
jgi:two-component system chemotaxis response regulator CheV